MRPGIDPWCFLQMCKWQEYICSLNDIVVDTSGFLGSLLYDEKSLLHQVLNIIGD
jgi:hypothetical protein